MMRKLVILGVIVLAAFGGWLAAVQNGALNLSDAYLKTRYTDARSRFVRVDGVPIHVVEEGRGPALLLVHGHLGSQRLWEGWADILRRSYRVIRFDVPPYGLSGPDPTGVYSPDRAYNLMERLVDVIEIGNFDMAASSSGGALAIRYAADHPDRVRKLVLVGAPSGKWIDLDDPPLRFSLTGLLGEGVLGNYRSEAYWERYLHALFGDPAQVNRTMVMAYADLNNRTGSRANKEAFQLAGAQSLADMSAVMAKVSAPVLIQWGEKSPYQPPGGPEGLSKLFSSSNVIVNGYPALGALPMVENPKRTVVDVTRFLSSDRP